MQKKSMSVYHRTILHIIYLLTVPFFLGISSTFSLKFQYAMQKLTFFIQINYRGTNPSSSIENHMFLSFFYRLKCCNIVNGRWEAWQILFFYLGLDDESAEFLSLTHFTWNTRIQFHFSSLEFIIWSVCHRQSTKFIVYFFLLLLLLLLFLSLLPWNETIGGIIVRN